MDKCLTKLTSFLRIATKDSYFVYRRDAVVVLITESLLTYDGVEVYVGETVSLECNASVESTWTRDAGDGSVDYVYWNRLIDEDTPRLSINITDDHVQRLIIADVQFNDTGLYDCYTGTGLRTVGYQLTVNQSMYYFGL